MSRISRESYEGNHVFHVMVQGINKESIFYDKVKKHEYMKLMKKYAKEYEIEIIAYCIMDNHAHILIKTKEIVNMTDFMHKTNTLYGIYYNKNLERVGFVFRNRFETQVIKDISYLYNCILYIHNNPVKAQKCNKAGDYLESSYYEFTNHALYGKFFKNKHEYVMAHTNSKTPKMFFIENDIDRENEVLTDINNYLHNKNINKPELQVNIELLLPIAKRLKDVYHLSNRSIGQYLNVGREKIRSILV